MNAEFTPTIEEIREACREIQERWSPAERRNRCHGIFGRPNNKSGIQIRLTIPEVRCTLERN